MRKFSKISVGFSNRRSHQNQLQVRLMISPLTTMRGAGEWLGAGAGSR